MNEKESVIIITSMFILGGLISLYFYDYDSTFNFYRSEITINGLTVSEKLYYKPDQEYHTLYRNFVDPVDIIRKPNTIIVNSVSCPSGDRYARSSGICYFNKESPACPAYTENNEYGCTFGYSRGFHESQEYTISAEYSLNPRNIYQIDGKYYIKFIAYSANRHKTLSSGNFIVESSQDLVLKDKYTTNENVIIYIPYTDSLEEKNIIASDFAFDKTKTIFNPLYLLAFLPAFIFFVSWYCFGKENVVADIPERLSMFPPEKSIRKPWQVAAYFNPPFGVIDKNLFSSTVLDFYYRKMIDIITIDKETYIKILRTDGLDEVEYDIMDILMTVGQKCSAKYRHYDYFNFKRATKSLFNHELKHSLEIKGQLLDRTVSRHSKEFLSQLGSGVMAVLLMFTPYLLIMAKLKFLVPLILVSFVVLGIISKRTAILSRHKKNYYPEYQHWQAFKNYLDESFSIREGTYRTVVMWDDYLVYATALGVSKKLIKELRAHNLITAEQETLYTGVRASGASFMSSSGTSGGGVGGGGGGGCGGGGGGGR